MRAAQAIKAGDIGLSSFAPELVANAIEDRLPQIRLKRSDPARLESRNRLEGPEQGVLNQVVGVCQIAGPPGQSSSSPALQRLDVALEQPLQCLLVPCTRAVEQMKSRLGIDGTRRVKIRGFPRTHAVFRHKGFDCRFGLHLTAFKRDTVVSDRDLQRARAVMGPFLLAAAEGGQAPPQGGPKTSSIRPTHVHRHRDELCEPQRRTTRAIQRPRFLDASPRVCPEFVGLPQ